MDPSGVLTQPRPASPITTQVNPNKNNIEPLRMMNKVAEFSFINHVLQIEKFADFNNFSQWQKLQSRFVKDLYQKYIFQVHYLNIENGNLIYVQDFDLINNNTFKFIKFENQDNSKIVPITFFLPKTASPLKKVPVAIYTHGGPHSSITPAAHHELFPLLASLGFAIVAPNYRGSSLDTEYEQLLKGHFPEYPVVDLKMTLNYIKTLTKIDFTKIFLTGISFGTYINALALKDIASDLAGVAFLKGQYQKDLRFSEDKPELSVYRGLFDSKNELPIFLAHGVLDKEEPIEQAIHFARNATQHFTNFSSFFAHQGNHHLCAVNQEVAPYKLTSDTETNWKNIDAIIQHADRRLNVSELRDFSTHLSEFFYNIAYPKVVLEKELYPYKSGCEVELFTRALVAKVRCNQSIKKIPLKKCKTRTSYLAKAPYSPSEAHLKIILGDEYEENKLLKNLNKFFYIHNIKLPIILNKYISLFSQSIVENEAKMQQEFEKEIKKYDVFFSDTKNINHTEILTNIKKELEEKYLKEKMDLLREKEKAQEECDAALSQFDFPAKIKVAEKIINHEITNKGRIFFYHAVSKEIAFVYSVYSSIHRLLNIQPGKNITRLRMLEQAFLKFLNVNDFIEKMDALSKQHSNVLYNYLNGYQDVGIAGQLFLFGSSSYWGSSSFFRYFSLSKCGEQKSLENLLIDFFDAIGLCFEGSAMEYVKKNYLTIYNKYKKDEHGTLLQFIFDPESTKKSMYISEVFGYPVQFDYGLDHEKSSNPVLLINRICHDPTKLESQLRAERANFKHQTRSDRQEFIVDDPNCPHIDSIEARLLMKPCTMDNLEIVRYDFQAIPEEFFQEIDEQVAKDVALWLAQRRVLDNAMLYNKPPLIKLYEYIENDRTGTLRKPTDIPENAETSMRVLRAKLKREPLLADALLERKFMAAEIIFKENPVEYLESNLAVLILLLITMDNCDAVEWILDKGITLHNFSYGLVAILLEIIAKNENAYLAVKLAQSKLPVNLKDSQGSSLLYNALAKDNYWIASFLVCQGASLDEPNEEGNTPRELALQIPAFAAWLKDFEQAKTKNIDDVDRED
jgi:dienelactone hydrolase